MKLYISSQVKGSASIKRLAASLTDKLGYRVWINPKKNTAKKQALNYGGGVDKLAQYKFFLANNIPHPEWTTDAAQAETWLKQDQTVFARHLLNASCGKGIKVHEGSSLGETQLAPVYTLYKKKKREFRVHIYRDKVVRVVEKKLRSDWNGPTNSKIRNLANGYVFCSCDSEPDGIRALALKAAAVVGSDFRGVDVGYNEKLNELFVIEVNSAPGIEGSNVAAYVNNII